MDFFPWKVKKKSQDSPLDAETQIYVRDDLASERLIDADFESLVSLPPSLDSREWIATHTVAFVEHINLLCGTILEFCTPTQCTSMSVPSGLLTWTDDKGKKTKCSASEYSEYVILFCQRCVADESQFPTKYGNKFPPNFDATLRRIYRLLAHVLAHLYHSHYRHLITLGLNGCLNTVTYHFALFLRIYNICGITSANGVAGSPTGSWVNPSQGGATEDRELSFILQLAERLHRPIAVNSNGEATLPLTTKPVARETTPIIPMKGEEFEERGIDLPQAKISGSASDPTLVKNGSASSAKNTAGTVKNITGTGKPEMGRLRQAMAGLTSRKETSS